MAAFASALRQRRRISFFTLAEEIGASETRVRDVLAGSVNPTHREVVALSLALRLGNWATRDWLNEIGRVIEFSVFEEHHRSSSCEPAPVPVWRLVDGERCNQRHSLELLGHLTGHASTTLQDMLSGDLPMNWLDLVRCSLALRVTVATADEFLGAAGYESLRKPLGDAQ